MKSISRHSGSGHLFGQELENTGNALIHVEETCIHKSRHQVVQSVHTCVLTRDPEPSIECHVMMREDARCVEGP